MVVSFTCHYNILEFVEGDFLCSTFFFKRDFRIHSTRSCSKQPNSTRKKTLHPRSLTSLASTCNFGINMHQLFLLVGWKKVGCIGCVVNGPLLDYFSSRLGIEYATTSGEQELCQLIGSNSVAEHPPSQKLFALQKLCLQIPFFVNKFLAVSLRDLFNTQMSHMADISSNPFCLIVTFFYQHP